LAVFKIRCQLNGASRAGFFAQSAIDAAVAVRLLLRTIAWICS
jgi:hypothetical protein